MALQVEQVGKQSGAFDLPVASQELVFMGERCQDQCTLADYAICEPWIAQVCIPVPLHVVCALPASRTAPRSAHTMFSRQMCRWRSSLSICLEMQVTGFVVNPEQPGKRFVEGVLVPCS